MQRYGKMRNADRFEDGQDDGTAHMVAGRVLPVRVGRADVEIGDVAGARPQGGQGEAREKGAT